jgi:hypothetical protein
MEETHSIGTVVAATILGRRVRTKGDVHVREFDGELVLLDLDRGEYFSLNEVGTRVWSLLAENRTLGEVVGILARDFDDVPHAELESDVLRIVTELVDGGLLAWADDPASPTP